MKYICYLITNIINKYNYLETLVTYAVGNSQVIKIGVGTEYNNRGNRQNKGLITKS